MAAVRKTTRAAKTTEAAVAAVKEVTPKTAMDKLGAAKQAIATKLAEVDALTLERITELQNLDIAIGQRKQEIKDLFDIAVTAETKAQLEADLATFREEADKAQEQTEADHNELIANRKKTWDREETDHKWAVEQRNKRDEDAFRFLQEQRQRAENLRIAALEEREKKMADLEAQVAALPQQLKDGVASATAAATEALKQKYEHAATVEKMNLDGQNKLLQAQIGSLQAQMAAIEKARQDAVTVAEKARLELNQIAREAVQASSGREALAAVQSAPTPTPAPAGRSR